MNPEVRVLMEKGAYVLARRYDRVTNYTEYVTWFVPTKLDPSACDGYFEGIYFEYFEDALADFDRRVTG